MNQEFFTTNIIDNLIKVMKVLTQFSPHPEAGVKGLQGSLRYFTGSDFPFFNGVFNNYENHAPFIKDDLAEITEFFTKQNVPFIWCWVQQEEIPTEIKQELDTQGFQFLGNFSGIAAKLDQIKLHAVHDNKIKVRQVNNKEEYKKFIMIIGDVFQLSDSIKKDMENMYQSYGQNGEFKHYLGFYADEPVSALTSYIDGNVVGFYNGATLPKAQKKGVCSALAQHIIQDAIKDGCEYGVSQLMAPAMAQGLSEKMGFKNYCTLLPFVKDPRKTK